MPFDEAGHRQMALHRKLDSLRPYLTHPPVDD